MSTLSPPAVLLGVQTPSLLHLPTGVVSHDAAVEAVQLAEDCGLLLDDSQKFTLRCALGERADGTWAAIDVVDEEPRQNGKGDTQIARQLAGLFLFTEDLQIATAHEFKTANEAFLRLVAVIDGDPALRSKVLRIRYANGEQGVELKSGARLKFAARSMGSGRGFAGVSTVYVDEAYAATGEHLAALLPTLSTHPNPQRWFASSAPLASSHVLWNLRRRAIIGNGGRMVGESDDRLAYVGHTAEVFDVDNAGRVRSVAPDPEDREAWALANPALGYRIDPDYVASELGTYGPAIFLRERLGVGDPEAGRLEEVAAKIDPDAWQKCHVSQLVKVEPKRCVFAIDCVPSGGHVSIAVGAGTSDRPYVEVVEHQRGVGWVARRIVELVQKWQPVAVGIDAQGPAGGLVGPIRAALGEANLDADILKVVTFGDMKSWCEAFHTDVMEGRLRVPTGQDHLDLAVVNATERRHGNAWLWDRRDTAIPISPLVAATIARGLAVELLAARPARVFAY